MTERLTGKDLLAKLEELGDIDQNEQIKACGYYLIRENGQERLLLSAFFEAKLEALSPSMLSEEQNSIEDEDEKGIVPETLEDKTNKSAEVNAPETSRTLYIKGNGYEWSNEYIDEELYNKLYDQYSEWGLEEEFLEEQDYDCDSLDVEDSGPSFPPDLILRNEDTGEEEWLNSDKSLEDLGVKINGDYPIKENNTNDNKEETKSKDYRIHKAEDYDGTWGKFDIEKGEIFDLSKLQIYVERKNCGDLTIDMCSITYDDKDLNEDICELGGNSIEWHLSK